MTVAVSDSTSGRIPLAAAIPNSRTTHDAMQGLSNLYPTDVAPRLDSKAPTTSAPTPLRVGVFWDPGNLLRYYINDVFILEINKEALRQLTPSMGVADRLIPREAMYILLEAASAAAADLPNPVSVGVDYVRLYQHPDAISTTCDPTELPTSAYIACHPDEFLFPRERESIAGVCQHPEPAAEERLILNTTEQRASRAAGTVDVKVTPENQESPDATTDLPRPAVYALSAAGCIVVVTAAVLMCSSG